MFHQHDHRTIHSVSFGQGTNTFVGIAGSFADWTVWSPTFELLSRRWRCVGFDHDGVGLTDVDLSSIDHDLHVDTLFSVLDAHGVERCVVGGHSVNASVAIDAVLRDPHRFNGLVVANGHAWDMDRPEIRAFVDALRTGFESAVEFFVDLVFPEPGSVDEQRWLREVMHQTGPEACARVLEAKYPVDLRRRLAEVAVPTLVLHGALDTMSPDPIGEATDFRSDIPDALLVELGDAGHLPLRTRPSAVADVLDAFLNRTTPLLSGTGVGGVRFAG